MKKIISISIATFVLIGCGGGGGGPVSGSDNFKKVDSVGYFEDAGIVGASYKCGDKTGITGRDGKFEYTTNEGCEFYIGDTVLAKFSPKVLSEESVHAILPSINAAKLLYALDKDSNIRNGFQIDSEKVDEILADKSIDFSRELSDEYEEFIYNLGDTENEISSHMLNRLEKMIGGKTYYAYIGSELFTVSFNSNLTKININGKSISTKKFFNILGIEDYTIKDDEGDITIYEYFKLKSITNDTITMENERDSQHYELKLYSSKKRAKESLIDVATLKKALQGKTLYQPTSDDSSGYLEIYKFKDGKLNVTDTYGNEIAINASYNIKEGKVIIIGEDNPTYSIVSYQKDKFIFALNSQTMEIEAFFYSKNDALNYTKELKPSSEVYFSE